MEKRAEFFLFQKNSPEEIYFLANRKISTQWEKVEFGKYNVFIPNKPTLDFLEDHRDEILKQWRK